MDKAFPLFDLPVELRLQIYGYAVDSGAITISSAPVHSCCLTNSSSVPGLPPNHSPIIRKRYDKMLLKPFVRTENCAFELLERPNTPRVDPTLPNLRLTCKQIREELQEFVGQGRIHLYLSWPNGVCVLMHDQKLKQLLRQAKTVNITGIFELDWFKRANSTSARVGQSSYNPQLQDGGGVPVQIEQLERLVTILLGPAAQGCIPSQESRFGWTSNSPASLTSAASSQDSFSSSASLLASESFNPHMHYKSQQPTFPLATLTIRTFLLSTRSRDSYHAIWADDTLAPPCVTLSKICGGNIRLSVARGRKGTGTEVVAAPNGGRSRRIECLWPKLESEDADVADAWCVPDDWER